jgi:hypothetical protein
MRDSRDRKSAGSSAGAPGETAGMISVPIVWSCAVVVHAGSSSAISSAINRTLLTPQPLGGYADLPHIPSMGESETAQLRRRYAQFLGQQLDFEGLTLISPETGIHPGRIVG